MENSTETGFDHAEGCSLDNNVPFDPSDYLPRRTNRASAHAASEAIKKSVTEEKKDPNKLKVDKSDPSKPISTCEAAKKLNEEQVNIGKMKSAVKGKSKQHSLTPYNCYVKLVRCEEDPALKTLVTYLQNWEKNPESSYKIVYGPSGLTENHDKKQFSSQANGSVAAKKGDNSLVGKNAPMVGKNVLMAGNSAPGVVRRVSKYLHHGSPPVSTQESVKNAKPSSLNVVVVHPKPGSKIINTSKGRESKSTLLHDLITDPNTVISNQICRIMTTGGNYELQCNKCSKTYLAARDLINHKRTAHKVSQHICTACAIEFPSKDGLEKHECDARYRCEICGLCCKTSGVLITHKKRSHPKTLGEYMCQVCCFNASSQDELNAHVCGGRPKINYSTQGSKPAAGMSTVQPKVMNMSGPSVPAGGGSVSGGGASAMQYLCEVCLNMYPSPTALASHRCGSSMVLDPMPPTNVNQPPVPSRPMMPPVPPPSRPFVPIMPVPMEVMPEVEQLAKFYSSVVFSE